MEPLPWCSFFITNVVSSMGYVYYLILRFKTRTKLHDFLTRSFNSFGALSHHQHLCIRLDFNGYFLWDMLWLPLIVKDRWIDTVYAFILSRWPVMTLKPRIFTLSFFRRFWVVMAFSSKRESSLLSSRLFMALARGSHCHIKMHHLLAAAGS